MDVSAVHSVDSDAEHGLPDRSTKAGASVEETGPRQERPEQSSKMPLLLMSGSCKNDVTEISP